MVKTADDWRKFAKPFLRDIWPTELRFQTPTTSAAIADMAADVGEAFPDAVNTVAPLLQPIAQSDSLIYSLTRKNENEASVAASHPVEAITLLDRSSLMGRPICPTI